MKRVILFICFALIFSFSMNAQNKNTNLNVSAVFIISKAKNNNYKYINFPRPNFIIKKGGIVDYNSLIGKKVKVTSIKEKDNGEKLATISLVSEEKFFNSHKYITADIKAALEEKELL